MLRSLLVLTGFSVGSLAWADPLGLRAAMDGAERASPELQALSSIVQAADSSRRAAGRLPEPRLAFGIENLPVTGPNSWNVSSDFMTMRSVGIMQDVPNSAKREAETQIADATAERARAQLHLRSLELRRDAALAWLDVYYVEQQQALFLELRRENELIQKIAEGRMSAGQGSVVEALQTRQANALLEDRRDQLVAGSVKARARLRRYVSVAPDQPLARESPDFRLDVAHLREHVHEHPELAVFGPSTTLAQAQVAEARARQRPDWGVALMYGHRGPQFGDMLSVQFTMGLPTFARDRNDANVESRLHGLDQVGADRDNMLREHVAELEGGIADYESASAQLERLVSIHLPLAQQQIDLRMAAYRAGPGSLPELLSARRELIELRLRQLELESQKAVAAAKLVLIYGGDAS